MLSVEEELECVKADFPIGTEVRVIQDKAGIVRGHKVTNWYFTKDPIPRACAVVDLFGFPPKVADYPWNWITRAEPRSEEMREQDRVAYAQYPVGCWVNTTKDGLEWRVAGHVTSTWYDESWWRDDTEDLLEAFKRRIHRLPLPVRPPLIHLVNLFGVRRTCVPDELEPLTDNRPRASFVRRVSGKVLCAAGAHQWGHLPRPVANDGQAYQVLATGGDIFDFFCMLCTGPSYYTYRRVVERCQRRGCHETRILYASGVNRRSQLHDW